MGRLHGEPCFSERNGFIRTIPGIEPHYPYLPFSSARLLHRACIEAGMDPARWKWATALLGGFHVPNLERVAPDGNKFFSRSSGRSAHSSGTLNADHAEVVRAGLMYLWPVESHGVRFYPRRRACGPRRHLRGRCAPRGTKRTEVRAHPSSRSGRPGDRLG